MPPDEPVRKWDLLVITASDPVQARYFDLQICSMLKDIWQFVKDYHIHVDKAPGIGSGLATADVISDIFKTKRVVLNNAQVLLVHSGGYSKRLPHVAPFGKVFAHLGDGKTILQHKLMTYQHLPAHLPSGVFVSASDTIETLNHIYWPKYYGAMLSFTMFGHYSDSEVAQSHGVFVMNDEPGHLRTVKKVLQKPTMEELDLMCPDGIYITDSCYFMATHICSDLDVLVNCIRRRVPDAELCCYGDFMRPIGSEASIDYIEQCPDRILKTWRAALYKHFNKLTGSESVIVDDYAEFYHFGTPNEFIENISLLQAECWCESNCIFSVIDYSVEIPRNSFVEYSNLSNGTIIGDGCILSGLRFEQRLAKEVCIPDATVVITWLLQCGRYVTIMYPTDADIKEIKTSLSWYAVTCKSESLFHAPLFPLADGAEQSLLMTIDYSKTGNMGGHSYISLAEAIKNVDVVKTFKQRQSMSCPA